MTASDLVTTARVSGSLLVVLLLVALAARLARRAGTRGGSGTCLAVRERIGLTRETSAVVLEAGDRLLLLGVSAQQITVLADLGAGPTVPADATGAALPQRTVRVPLPRAADGVRVVTSSPFPLTRRQLRESGVRRRQALPPTQRGSGAPLDPRTWQQGLEALRDLTARRG